MFQVISTEPGIDSTSPLGQKPGSVAGRIDFRNIDFTYPSRPDIPILKNFSLTIQPGETIAFVGPSGCGKSTVVGLLQRFYKPLVCVCVCCPCCRPVLVVAFRRVM
jgi:ATP-binding cassette, subfamily B (MDR/TAP), member 1